MRFFRSLSLSLGAVLLAGAGARADTIRNPTAIFAGLDKITGRIISFDVAIDETVQFGTLQITPRLCLTRPQTETPLTESFIEVDEVDAAKTAKRIFSGWMFAASPGLHGVEHPVYDVWLKNCKGGVEVTPSPVNARPDANAPPPPNAAPPPKEGVAAKKPRRTIEPQEPVEPSMENLPPTTPDSPAPPPERQPGNVDDGLGAPIEVGPAPGGSRPTQGLDAPADAAPPPGAPKPPKPKRKPLADPNAQAPANGAPVPPAPVPPAPIPQQQQAAPPREQPSGPQQLLDKIPFLHGN